jgi:hypothetical protein
LIDVEPDPNQGSAVLVQHPCSGLWYGYVDNITDNKIELFDAVCLNNYTSNYEKLEDLACYGFVYSSEPAALLPRVILYSPDAVAFVTEQCQQTVEGILNNDSDN